MEIRKQEKRLKALYSFFSILSSFTLAGSNTSSSSKEWIRLFSPSLFSSLFILRERETTSLSFSIKRALTELKYLSLSLFSSIPFSPKTIKEAKKEIKKLVKL